MLKNMADQIYHYHEHDSLLENKVEDQLTEEERKAAWDEFEREKKTGYRQPMPNFQVTEKDCAVEIVPSTMICYGEMMI